MGLLRYPGGKSRRAVKLKILNRFPKTFNGYREPCCGGAALFFAVDRSIPRWINDINPDLMAVYFALRDRPDEFIKKCREIEPAKDGDPKTSAKGGKTLYDARLKSKFDELIQNRSVDPALSYYFINRVVYAGRVNYSRPSRLYYSNPSGWNIIKTDALEKAAEALINTKITVGCFRESLLTPGEDVFIYLDPPYFFQMFEDKGSQLYEFNFTEKDHVELADIVKDSKHKILLSYDNHPRIRELYSGLNITEDSWTYCGSANKKKEVGTELLISNY